jgi:hypothetical protein
MRSKPLMSGINALMKEDRENFLVLVLHEDATGRNHLQMRQFALSRH